MAVRDLNFNIFANDRASQAFARVAGVVEDLSQRLVRLSGQRANPQIALETREFEKQLRQAEIKLAELNRDNPNPQLDLDIAKFEAKVAEAKAEFDALDKERITPEIQLKIDRAQAQIHELEDDLTKLGQKESSPVVNMQTAVARNQIAQLRQEILDLSRTRATPEIAVNMARAEAQLREFQARLDELRAMRADPAVDLEIAAAMAKIVELKAALASIRNPNVRVDVSTAGRDVTMLTGLLGKMNNAFADNLRSAASLTRSLRQLAIPGSLIASIPNLASLGATLVDVSKAGLLIVPAALAAGAAVGTLALAFNGLTAAIGPRDTEAQIKKADLAMSRLGVDAQQVAKAVIALKPAWNDLKQTVQNDFFKDVGIEIKSLGATYLPLLKSGLGGMATEFNGLITKFDAFLRQAGTIKDTSVLFSEFQATVHNISPGLISMSAGLKDIGVVAGSFLPGLAQGFTNLMDRFAVFTARARDDGSLQLWTAQGILAIKQVGDMLGNLAGIFGGIFEASQKAGSSFVETWGAAFKIFNDFVHSQQGQAGLINLFQGIRQVIDAISPGIKALLGGMADGIVAVRPAVDGIGEALSSIATKAAPTFKMLGEVAVTIITPLAAAIKFVADTVGGAIPLVITLAVAFKAFSAFGAVFATLGTKITGMSTAVGIASIRMGASGVAAQGAADATSKLGNAFTRIGNSLPLIGVAIVALGIAWDQLKSKTVENTQAILNGASTVSQAIDKEVGNFSALSAGLAGVNVFASDGEVKQQEYAIATNRVNAELQKQLSVLNPLQYAQANVTIAEGNYNDALQKFGENSPQAIAALATLKSNKESLTAATLREAQATQTSTEKLIENSNAVMAAGNADAGLDQANLSLERQIATTNATLKTHTASSIEGRQATLDLRQAYLSAAEAAGRKAEADATARGEADAAAQGAKAYQLALINLAGQSSGPTRQALLGLIANFDGTRDHSYDAALKAAGLTAEIHKIPPTAQTVISTPGMPQAMSAIDQLKQSIAGIQDKSFSIRGSGKLSIAVGGVATGGILGFQGYDGGGVMPGYTPGRDVHYFTSPTAGGLALSGGEAVMRPEWTQAMGTSYVHGANAAARTGGVMGVQKFVQTGHYAEGGVWGKPKEYNLGGVIDSKGITHFAEGGVSRNIVGHVSFDWIGQTVDAWYNSIGPALQAAFDDAVKKMAAAAAASGGGVPAGRAGNVAAVQAVAAGYGWGSGVQWNDLVALINRESGFNNVAQNPTSTAYGIFQFLNGTWASYGVAKTSDPGLQAVAGLRYIAQRYGSPAGALAHENAYGWYDQGGMASGRGWMRKNIVHPERVLSPDQTAAFERLVNWLTTSRGIGSQGGTSVDTIRAAIQNGIRDAVAAARQVVVNYQAGALSSPGNSSNLANDMRTLAQFGI